MKRSFRNFNKMLLPFMMIFLSLLLTSYTPPASQKKVRKVKVVISNGELKINKNEFIHPWSFKLFMEALGEHNRVDPGVNDIYTYDKLGIILYKNPKSDEVTDFNIYLGSDPDEDYDFIPTGLFKDNLNIDGIKITSKTSLAKVKKALPQYAFNQSVIGAYRGEYNKLYIYIQFDPTEENIYWLSFGIKD